jgi:hypothetical protein
METMEGRKPNPKFTAEPFNRTFEREATEQPRPSRMVLTTICPAESDLSSRHALDAVTGDEFGGMVAISGAAALVSANDTVYVFEA